MLFRSETFKILFNIFNEKNLGQQNCGIIPYNNFIIKCIDRGFSSDAQKLNEKIKNYFPNLYLWEDSKFYKEIETKKFYIMERLEGDLTKYIMEQSYINFYNVLDNNYKLYYESFPKTMINSIYFPYTTSLSDSYIKNINEIRENVKPKITELLIQLQPDIIELHHNLIKNGYSYQPFPIFTQNQSQSTLFGEIYLKNYSKWGKQLSLGIFEKYRSQCMQTDIM